MKKHLAARMRLSALIIAGALGTFALVTPHLLEAQSAPEKIRLMADTLRARDSGNLNLAKDKAEELIKIAPNDDNVQRLLASINQELDRRGSLVASTVVPSQPTNQDVEVAVDTPSATDTSKSSTQSILRKRLGLKTSQDLPQVATSAADAAVAEAAADQDAKIAAARNAIAEAQQLAKLGAYSDASNLLNAASASLTLNTATAKSIEELEQAKAKILFQEARAIADAGNLKAAEAKIDDYRAAGGNSTMALKLERELDEQISDPYNLNIKEISPEYVAQIKIIRDLLAKGRAQYLNGDYDGASATFNEVEARDANNSEAKLFQIRIADILGAIHTQNHYKTREQMLTEVAQQWERPKVFDISATDAAEVDEGGRIKDKLNAIVIPQVNFSGMELTSVVETLSELSVEYDPERIGVNIIPLFNSNDSNPRVNISLRNLNLDRILQFVTQQVNFAYDVGGDAVTIQPSDSLGGSATSVTEFFPISRATVIRLTGFRDSGGSSSGPVDPFAPSGGGSSGPSQNDEVVALQNFFQSAGVNFEITGASLAFDGEQLIVTQSRRNLERMRTILRNYNEVKQVEIEAKFLEVAQGDLEELGFNYTFNRFSNNSTTTPTILREGVAAVPAATVPIRFRTTTVGGVPSTVFGTDLESSSSTDGSISFIEGNAWVDAAGNLFTSPIAAGQGALLAMGTFSGETAAIPEILGSNTTTSRDLINTSTMGGRGISTAFGGTAATANATITTPGEATVVFDASTGVSAVQVSPGQSDNISFSAPSLPGVIDLAQDAAQFFTYGGLNISRGLDVDIAIQALMRKTSSDLMSAPKITVLSGKRASIVVAQELRYPESYGDIESTVSSSNSGGSAISITAGTPQDFVTRNVGVEMSVTPNVENDDTISLILEPRVTEFEGFVEYGGPSIALAGGTSALVPAGFYQPIFSTREISTEVTVFDGATIVMGGLTREDVKSVSDKVPFLGDMPGIGRLFRSEGETRMKRNLLIFITANLVSPGGSPARQNYRNVNANSLFQNPTIMTPSGSANRSIGASR